jgi:nitroreductase
MDALQAIHSRQSVAAVKPDPIPRDIVEKLLSAAVQAPNHYKVRPWRFVVLSGSGRERLGEVLAKSFSKRFPDLPAEAQAKERAKPLRAPLVIAIGVDKPAETKVIEVENISAASAAAQNLLLAAHTLGLAAKWRTGDEARDPMVKQFLGFTPDQHVVAFLYIGYPETEAQPVERPGFDDRTVWMED